MATNTPLDLDQLFAALASEDVTWQPAHTSMTALSEDEREIRLGVPPTPGRPPESLEDDVEKDAAAAAAATAEAIGAPAAFDVRNVNGINFDTPVKDQLDCGSCVAFGVAATMEVVFRKSRYTTMPMDLSEAHLFYCHARNGGRNCGNGWWPDRALTAAKNSGVSFEDYYRYTAGDQNCSNLNADWPNRVALVTDFSMITGDAAAMKEAISTYGAVTACLDVYQDFFSYSTGVYKHVAGSYAGGHCVVLIGYSDAEGCWIGRNSWGTGWGSSGYFKIAYGQCRIESYQTGRVPGVRIRSWLPNQTVAGLWSNEADANVWVYGSQRGWLKLDGGNVQTNVAMLNELAASKALARPVGLFEDNGSVHQIYAW